MSMGENMHKEEPQMTVQPPAACTRHALKQQNPVTMENHIVICRCPAGFCILYIAYVAVANVCNHVSKIAEPFISCLFFRD